VSFHVPFLSNPKTEHSGKVFVGENKFPLGHGNTGKCRRSKWQARFPAYCKPIKIPSDVALYGAIACDFQPLLGLIGARADELPVIKDSEAVQYVGKNVEVRGLVVSVTISPLGTACISFGREYPNQTVAGFIAIGSKMETDERIAMLQGKIIGITGIIELHQGKPEIQVTSGEQIKGLDSQPSQ